LNVSTLAHGDYDVTVTGTFEDGQSIDVRHSFTRSAVVPIVRTPTDDWPMFRKTAAGSSFTATEVAPPLEMAWSTPAPGMIALSSPVVAGGRVYLGCRPESDDLDTGGVLCCDAASGAMLWYAPVPGGVSLAPAVAGGLVLVTTMADSALALDALSGNRVWGMRTPGNKYKMTAPVFEGPDAWVGSEPTPMAIDWATGTARWTTTQLGAIWYPAIYSVPAIGPQYLYFSFYGTPGRSPDGFSVVDRTSGVPVYQENGSFRSAIVTPSAVYVIGDYLLNNQRLTARSATGSVLWTAATDFSRGTGAPAIGHGVLVAPGQNGAIEGVRASDGASLWSHPVGTSLYDMSPNRRRQRDTIGAPAITDSVVYAGSLDGNLYALDLASGACLWSWYFGTPVGSSPAASGNMIFVGASDGHLYAFAGSANGAAPGGAGLRGRASVFALYPPRPNPSDRQVRLEWVLPKAGNVRVDIHDLAGRRVRGLANERREAGEGGVGWDGTDDAGRAVAAGVYFARVRTAEGTAVRKLVRLRP
jgi:outer membrane protein assembly factor BamB